jgi:hypothetical protein
MRLLFTYSGAEILAQIIWARDFLNGLRLMLGVYRLGCINIVLPNITAELLPHGLHCGHPIFALGGA